MQSRVRQRSATLVYLCLGIAGLVQATSPAAGQEAPQQTSFQAQFLRLCDESCPILRRQAQATEKGSRVFYMDSYAVRALMVAYDMTGKQEYFDASRLWCDRMLEYQQGMIPAGAYHMQYGRKPGEDKGDWYAADSSSIALGVLAVSVRSTDPKQKQRYLDSVKAFFKLVADRFVRPSGGVTDGYWPKSDDEWWCSTGIFGSLAFHLYAETREESYLRIGLGTIDWLNRQDLLGMKDFAMPIVLMYSLEAYSASLPYLPADTPRRTAALGQLGKIQQWILSNRGGHSGIEYASWAGSKSAGLPFHLYVFARLVPGHDKLVPAADEELRYVGGLLEKDPRDKNRGHLVAFALMSYAEKLSPGSIDRPSVVSHAGERKIYIMTDLEGASGVYKFAQTREPNNPLGETAKEYLMGDIAAVVRGLRAGGATEILVIDGHGSQAFVPHLMAPGAKYVTGKPRPEVLWGLDKSFAGLVLLGHHAMNGTPDGVLCHTQSSKSENRYWYNGVESGELAQVAAVAGHHGVPPILVTGDEATCREAHRFFGTECVTVAVKRGLGREAAVLYPFEETRKALFGGAKQAVAAIPKCKPYRIQTPIRAKKEFLEFEGPAAKGRLVTKEGTISDVLRLFEF